MIPVSFDESDAFLNPPEGVSLDDCHVLSIKRIKTEQGWPAVVSCWKLTKEEMEEVKRTGRIWLAVTGMSMPPVWLDGFNPFQKQPSEEPEGG